MKPSHKISLLALLLFITAIHLAAQVFPPDDVSRQFGSPAEDDISRKIISTADGHFLVAGTFGDASFIMKLTSCGDTLWLKTWLFGTKTVFNDIGELPGGQLVAAGYCENCADDVNDTADKMLLVKTDASGETIQDAKLGMENRDAHGIALVIAPDSSVVVAGHTLVGGIAGNQVHLYRINSQDFSVQWQSFFAQLFLDYAGGLTMTTDGTFLITGWSLDFGGPEHFTAYHVMADGNISWKNKWNLNGLATGVIHRATAATQLPGQDFVLLGRVYMDTLRNEEVLMAKIDFISGDTLVAKTFGSAGNDKGNDIHVVNGNEFLVAWDEGAGLTANLSRLDANFEEIETKTWDHSILAYYILSVVPLSNDGEDYALVRNQFVYGGQWDFFFIKHATAGHLARLTEMP